MKLLLDENLPKRLKNDFPEHEIFTVREQGWSGLKNGQLLEQMLNESFDALITFDKNLQYQQNFKKYPLQVIVLNAVSNRYPDLHPLSDRVKDCLLKLQHGVSVVEE